MPNTQYKREISERIGGLATQFPAVVITGARQVGKTTLLRAAFPTHSYVTLDVPVDAELAESDPAAFLRLYPPPILIDEVQYAPKLFRHLKVAIDQQRQLKGTFILTGSQKFTLMKAVSDSLAGRCALVEMEGLSTRELGVDLRRSLVEYGAEYVLHRGSFPELWADRHISSVDFYRSYLSTYLERDVRQLLNVSSLRDFDRFLRACAVRSGQLINKSDLARDVGISPTTVNEWLSVAEASNQIHLIEPWFASVGLRMVKSPRLFFGDTGLLCFMLGLDRAALASYAGIGALWETFVYGELRKRIECEAVESKLWFYRDKTSREIDFMIDRGGKLTLAEVKWTALPTTKQTETMQKVAAILGDKVRRQIVIARPTTPYPLTDRVKVVDGFSLESSDLW